MPITYSLLFLVVKAITFFYKLKILTQNAISFHDLDFLAELKLDQRFDTSARSNSNLLSTGCDPSEHVSSA